jgi:hypothetical protein
MLLSATTAADLLRVCDGCAAAGQRGQLGRRNFRVAPSNFKFNLAT